MEDRTYEAYKINHEFTTVEHIHYEFNSGIEVYVKIERLPAREDASVYIEIIQTDHVTAFTMYSEKRLPTILSNLMNMEDGDAPIRFYEISTEERDACNQR